MLSRTVFPWCSAILLAALTFPAGAGGEQGDEATAGRQDWRGGWGGLSDVNKLIECAKEVSFNALIVHGPKERMRELAERARKNGIESYFWYSTTARGKELEPFKQVMGERDQARLEELKADRAPKKHGYQFGGEPQPERHEVLLTPLLCFHRPEVVAYSKRQVREMLEACPALTGVAFDYFGYQNYRCCLCPKSRELLEAYRGEHPDLSERKAQEQFSLSSLVRFTNELADFVREVRPGARTAIHVYPVFLPEPLYGNRLDVDYCCQTVAWFFEPYWSPEKIARYVRTVVKEQNRYHLRQRGIPFVGLYVGRPSADKSPERFASELQTIHQTAGNTSLSVCTFNDFLKYPQMREVAKGALVDFGRKGGRTQDE